MNMQNETESVKSPWTQVRNAITTRWPNLPREQMDRCADDVTSLVDFVKGRVEASEDEIQAVIGEFAPQEGFVHRITEAANDKLQRGGEDARSAVKRADEVITNHPREFALTSFVFGLIVGGSIAALLMKPKPEPSAWDRFSNRPWT